MKKNNTDLYRIIFAMILLIFIAVFGSQLLASDFVPVLSWWFTTFVLGLIVLPLTGSMFQKFNDRGYPFSKVIGIAFVGYSVWLSSSMHLFKFTRGTCLLIAVIGFIVIYGYYLVKAMVKKKKNQILEVYDLALIKKYLLEELCFLAIFLVFIYIKGFKPDASGTEKFMDYGFMTIMNRSNYMPAEDLWYAGSSLNYYYVGQFMATFLTKLSGVKITEGYNLMLMFIAAITTILPYSITVNLLKNVKDADGNQRCKNVFTYIGGTISAFAVTFAGNMHYSFYHLLVPFIVKFLSIEYQPPKYWFPDATRYIGYQPDLPDKTIHEFPSYSFILGDLHAHVINLIFVLTLLGLLLAWQINRDTKKKLVLNIRNLKDIIQPSLFLMAFLIGIFQMTNYWDYPIYYIVCGAVILFTNLSSYKSKLHGVYCTLIQGVYMMGFVFLTALPFKISFDQISTSMKFAKSHSLFRQLVVLWGLPVVVIVGFIIFRIIHMIRGKKLRKDTDWSHMDRFAILLGLCAMGLVLIPEIAYVVDIYKTYPRANTMFKLTYQAFLMMGILFGYIFIRLIAFKNKRSEREFSILFFVIFLSTLGYSVTATKDWFGNIFKTENYKGIDCAAFLANRMPEDAKAIDWLNENVTGTAVVLEANGDSYTDYERVSVFTGLPTVLGWRTHEWLWRGVETLDERAALIKEVYSSNDRARVLDIIERFDIEYIFVGSTEKEKFQFINHDLIRQLGDVVFESNDSPIYADKTYIVKVNRYQSIILRQNVWIG